MDFRVTGNWWEVLSGHGVTLLITREYEHLVVALSAHPTPRGTFMRLPHPSGLVADRRRGIVYVASTRNPNQVYDLAPVIGIINRLDVPLGSIEKLVQSRPLIPVRSRFLPGSLYLHDLAIIDSQLFGNAVGENAVVRLHEDGRVERKWWPKCIETPEGPVFGRNYLQLNSIAAGKTLETSYFSASTDRISARRPSHKNFQVDHKGVIFSGRTREVVARGLTRPHSTRFHRRKLWVDNSGYGELGVVDRDRFEPVAKLPGWTRGLCFHRDIAFVGTSRVIPRFRQYAPGLDLDKSVCGVHAVDTKTGAVLGSLVWPHGNQIFAVDWVPSSLSRGFAFAGRSRPSEQQRRLFYAFKRSVK
ncbi:MAG TPA: DUF4915 domain-containing protein [Candidatus Dormibacteraeota bacterium]|nr:DUF4915 domain-containing protein [Candidatus Dormibacteraeota bacterium]